MKWPRKRTLTLALVIFIAQMVAIFALHTPTPMVTLPEGVWSPLQRVPAGQTNPLGELDGLSDPLVFAGAHEHGFSAFAWMMRPKTDYEVTNTLPTPRFLQFQRVATDFSNRDFKNSSEQDPDLPFVQVEIPPVDKRSLMRVDGGLVSRALLREPKVPIQYATDVLSNTVVQVAVQADGFPFSARIISGSGSRGADLAALNIATRTRFAPLPPVGAETLGDLQWGQLVFQWFTTEPVATNNPSEPAVSGAK
jgi:TonB family protein